MTGHSDHPSTDVMKSGTGEVLLDPPKSSTAGTQSRLSGRIFYWWSLFVAAMLLLVLGPPVILVSWLAGRRHWVYPSARFGARNWLRWSGMKVKVRGLENLDPKQPYVFIANHRSYLDTATMFHFLNRRIGLLAKKELLKVPILGYGMGYVNIMAIDRSNRERAIRTVRAATERIASGISFAVFAEGTRAPVGKLLPFKKGAFYMAVEAGVPVVPVSIRNTDMLMGKGTGTARPGLIEMIVMPPIPTDPSFSDAQVKELIAETHRQVAQGLGLNNSVDA